MPDVKSLTFMIKRECNNCKIEYTNLGLYTYSDCDDNTTSPPKIVERMGGWR